MCLSQRQRFLEDSNISQTYTETYGYVHTHNYKFSHFDPLLQIQITMVNLKKMIWAILLCSCEAFISPSGSGSPL